jgi:hypothetical protein
LTASCSQVLPMPITDSTRRFRRISSTINGSFRASLFEPDRYRRRCVRVSAGFGRPAVIGRNRLILTRLPCFVSALQPSCVWFP